jgi:hypothetical protein
MVKKDSEFKPKVSVVGYYVNSISEFLDLLYSFKAESRSFVVCCSERESCILLCQPTHGYHNSHQPCLVHFYLSWSFRSPFFSFSFLLDCRPPPRRAVVRARSLFRDSCSSARSIAPRSRKTNRTSPSVVSERSWGNCGGRSPTRRRKSTSPGRAKKTNNGGNFLFKIVTSVSEIHTNNSFCYLFT